MGIQIKIQEECAMLKKGRAALAAALIAVGAAFIGLGIWRGEVETVIRKAITVCLECIGIG